MAWEISDFCEVKMLSEHYFGDVEAIDEGRNHTEYFKLTYIIPSSFSYKSINNISKYIIVGRKGTGKTAVQFHLSKELEDRNYFTHFFSFHNDIKQKDYLEAVKSQSIDILKLDNNKNLFLNYDFRDVWARTFLIKIAETLHDNEINTKFTRFAMDGGGKFRSIFDGLLKSLTVKVSAEAMGISAEIGIDTSKTANGEFKLGDLIEIFKTLIVKYHKDHKLYLFVDELVFSKLDKTDDEYKVRAAMVRDIFRCARDLNNFFAAKSLDIHIVCSLRPEIRDVINDLDSEIGKIFDGKSVNLEWDSSGSDNTSLIQILKNKIIHSKKGAGVIDFDNFFAKEINFGDKNSSIPNFLSINTWGRPRDIVQLLNSISIINPNAEKITEKEIKKSLADYSRKSFYELLEEISVMYGDNIAETLKKNINKREYTDFNEFADLVFKNRDYDLRRLSDDLFRIGIIGNVDKSKNPPRFYWAHRGDTYLNRDLQILIHNGLWHYLQIQ